MTPSHLADGVAVITGAASGIGLALAQRATREGMTVVATDIDEVALEEAKREIVGLGGRVHTRIVDVAEAAHLDALADDVYERFGSVRLLFNNAGVAVMRPFLETSLQDWMWTLDVNLWGVVHGMRAFVPRMVQQQQRATVMNTASAAGLTSPSGLSPYNVTKQGVVALTETVQRELQEDGVEHVRIAVLCPELIATQIHRSERNRPNKRANESELENRAHLLEEPMQSAMKPYEVADLAFAALESDQIHILTHPESTGAALQTRVEAILSPGGEGVEN
ncbi:MAG: SDR family NAD(P)-dependent oxidoreductase [Acidobacteriota bacterium]